MPSSNGIVQHFWSADAGTLILFLATNNSAADMGATYFTQLVIMAAPWQVQQVIFRWWNRGGLMQIACDDVTGAKSKLCVLALCSEQTWANYAPRAT